MMMSHYLLLVLIISSSCAFASSSSPIRVVEDSVAAAGEILRTAAGESMAAAGESMAAAVGGRLRTAAPVFDINEAYQQLMYSYSAYCPNATVQPWTCFFCSYNKSSTSGFVVSNIIGQPLLSTYGYIGYRGSIVEVVFRGTVDLENWISNLDFSHSTPYPNLPGGYVHSGFLADYDSVKVSVKSDLARIISQINATGVVFTGHSLGAALATLAAYDILPSLKIPVAVYTFGSPRVGNQIFSNSFYQLIPNSFRIVNQADIVPHLPVSAMGFHHVAREVWWKTNSTYVVCNTSGEDSTCSDSILVPVVADHLDYLGIPLHQGSC